MHWFPEGIPLTDPLLEVQNLAFTHPGRKRPIFQNHDFSLGEEERVVLFGANGSGKTTLLSLLNGLRFPDRGEVRFRGQPVSRKSLRDRSFRRRFRKESVFLFQNPDVMLFHPTVREEIAFGPRELELEEIEKRVEDQARQCNLESLLDEPPHRLSGGERKRVALASILVLSPSLFLLDEPVAGLDIPVARWFAKTVRETGSACVSALHDLESAHEFGDRALVLAPDGGGILFDGPLEEYRRSRELQKKAHLF